MSEHFLSIDVGTASVRTALVTPSGKITGLTAQPIKLWRSAGIMEQSSDDIFQATLTSIQQLLSQHKSSSILGIGVDATASQVFLDKDMNPLPLPSNSEANILGWFDHRSIKQSERINQFIADTDNNFLTKQIPEMTLSKLLWLHETHPDFWQKCYCILDLYDYLTWRLTGQLTRTPTSMVNPQLAESCKQLGIDIELKIQGTMIDSCSAIPGGLSKEVASQLGLRASLPVAAGMIDGYAGSLAVLGAETSRDEQLCTRLSMIVGTSSIYISTSQKAVSSDLFWGPIPSVLEGYFHNIVGQSAAGALIDHTIQSHPAYSELMHLYRRENIHVSVLLEQRLLSIAGSVSKVPLLTKDIHVLPFHAGNRTPLMDMSLRGMICGLSIDNSLNNLALIYLATLQALALEARFNLLTLSQNDYSISELLASGGLAKNRLFLQIHADALALPIKLPNEPDSMSLGGALLAAVACGHYSLREAMRQLSGISGTVRPNPELQGFYCRKYEVFLALYQDQRKYREIMQCAETKKAD